MINLKKVLAFILATVVMATSAFAGEIKATTPVAKKVVVAKKAKVAKKVAFKNHSGAKKAAKRK